MKIRWSHQGIRFRITPTEFENLKLGQRVEECLDIGETQLTARIDVVTGEGSITSTGNSVTLECAVADILRLAEQDREGIYFSEWSEKGVEMVYYIEKDFPCVHVKSSQVKEEPSETFTPPLGFADRKLSE